MRKILCPSMMCASYRHLEEEIRALEAADIDIFHVDIMDGTFVPNFGMGIQDTETICRLARKEVDAHLMIREPNRYIDLFAGLGVSIVYIHPESDGQPVRTLQKIKSLGMRAGIAVSPEIAIEYLRPLLTLADDVLVMTVNPGFSGQAYLPFVDEKIEQLTDLRERSPEAYRYRVFVDGACSPEQIARLSPKGVDGFILGTASLFKKERPYNEIVSELRKIS